MPAPEVAGGRPAIDPRIRQRRAQVRRHEGRRRLRVVLGVAALVATAAAAYGATRSALLDVDHVHVLGATRTPAPTVRAAAGLAYGRAMVEVPGDAVRRLEALPWVRSAEVRRRWPGTVEVRITERAPAVALPAGTGAWALADADGRILDHSGEAAAVLPRLVGAPPAGRPGESVDPVARGALGVAALLGPLAARTPEVRLLPDGALELAVVAAPDGRAGSAAPPEGTVLFGPPTQVGEKLVALTTVLERVDLVGVRTLDVRVPSAPVLTRDGPAVSVSTTGGG